MFRGQGIIMKHHKVVFFVCKPLVTMNPKKIKLTTYFNCIEFAKSVERLSGNAM